MMSQAGADAKVPGARRQKVMGYIRAANELRQSYSSQISSRMQGEDDEGMPGSFPDVDIVRSGDEEMLLFPSYAKKHIKKAKVATISHRDEPGAHNHIDNPDGGDADYWRREWERYEDANAIVDVDVRGWIYSPQKGPLSRRNRLVVAVARRLSGVPAPDVSPANSRDSSQHHGFRERINDGLASQEEEAAAREAEIIARRGQREFEAASQGDYRGRAARGESPSTSRSSSPSRPGLMHSASTPDFRADEDPGLRGVQKRMSWNQSNTMSRQEIVAANEQLMKRLSPFMTMPLANTAITIFFFNDQKSRSKSVLTDDSGHFNLRAALDFVPDKVRVLASDKLSSTEDVIVTDTQGISLVSDIDDTIKHSAIASGAREIFKNTFIRELGDLTIQGVKEWYTKVAELGVKLHYVSNSPWQLYPLLRTYFTLAGLPPGSMHLKQYSGMLQGIFEPAAERKKASLDRIMHDFPERKFILVGDSGEADLEVYTDVVLAHPGRVLGVFIRDVTSPRKTEFFDHTQHRDKKGDETTESVQNKSESESLEERPALPSRPNSTPFVAQEEDLIDFSDEPSKQESQGSNASSMLYNNDPQQLGQNGTAPPQAPNKPNKPSNLRSFTTTSQQAISTSRPLSPIPSSPLESKRSPPPKPRRPSSSVNVNARSDSPIQDRVSTPSQIQTTGGSSRGPAPAPPPPRTMRPSLRSHGSSHSMSSSFSGNSEEGYLASARRQISTAYNSLPPIRSQSPVRDASNAANPSQPPRRGLTSYPAAAARWATGASGGDPAAGGDGGAPGAPYDKKLEMWKRRWARSEDIMKRNGVIMRTWRVGGDVMDECIRLIERAKKSSEASRH